MKKISFLFFIILLITSVSAFAQPKIVVHLTGGYGVPLGDFKQDIPTTGADADFFPTYTKHMVNFGADGKLSVSQKGNFRVTFGVGYNMFSNNTDALFQASADTTLPLVSTNFKPKVNILTIALGGEWAFMPKDKIDPFVGVDLTGNFFSGSFTFGQPVFVKGAERTAPMDMKAETRIGILFDTGVDFMLSKQVGAVAGINYHIINVFGKGADVESEVGPNEIDLGDKEHVLDDGTTTPSKTLSSFNGYIGVSFYFGAPKPTAKPK